MCSRFAFSDSDTFVKYTIAAGNGNSPLATSRCKIAACERPGIGPAGFWRTENCGFDPDLGRAVRAGRRASRAYLHQEASDVDEVVGNHPEPDPTAHAVHAVVSAAC